jgi:hypothetical protein
MDNAPFSNKITAQASRPEKIKTPGNGVLARRLLKQQLIYVSSTGNSGQGSPMLQNPRIFKGFFAAGRNSRCLWAQI